MQGSNLSSNLDAALLETVSYYNDRNLVISSTLLMIKDQRLFFRIINWSHRIINWSHRINMIKIQFSFSLSTSVQTSIRIRKLESSSSSNPTFWIAQQNLINRSILNIMDRAHQHQHQIMFNNRSNNNSSSNNNNSSINSFDLQDAQKEHSHHSNGSEGSRLNINRASRSKKCFLNQLDQQ
jgi:hypothetical protein